MPEKFFFFTASFCGGFLLQVRFPWFPKLSWIILGCLLSIVLLRGFKKDLFSFLLLCIMLIAAGYVRSSTAMRNHLHTPPAFQNNQTYPMQLYDKKNNTFQIQVLPSNISEQAFTIFLREEIDFKIEEGCLLKGTLHNLQFFPEAANWKIRADVSDLELLSKNEAPIQIRMMAFLNTIRIQLKNKIRQIFTPYPHLQTFLLTALLQQYTADSQEMAESFRQLGLLHVLCVSGFHISILTAILLFFLNLFHLPPKPRSLICGAFILLYGAITGFSPAVLRSVSCALIALAGITLQRNTKSLRILCFVLLIHSALFPLDALRPGFHLSYGLCFFLLLHKKPQNWRQILKQAIFVQVFVLPYTLYAFEQYPLFSIVSLLISPLLGFILIYGFIALGCSLFVLAPILLANRLFAFLAEVTLYLIDEMAQNINFNWDYRQLPLSALCTIYVIYTLMLLRPNTKQHKNKEMIDSFETYCLNMKLETHPQPGLELLKLLIQEKDRFFVNSDWTKTELIDYFLEQWKKQGQEQFLPFIRFGLMAEYITLEIREKIFTTIQAKIKNEKLVFDLLTVSNPVVKFFLSGQKSYHNLNCSRQIINFLSLHASSNLIQSLFEPANEMDYFWQKTFLILEKTSYFELYNSSAQSNKSNVYAKYYEIRELLSSLSLV